MNRFKPSIRATLLAIITTLNLLIAGQCGYKVYTAWQRHNEAQTLQKLSHVMDNLFTTEKFLSAERGTAMAVLYLKPEASKSHKKYLEQYQKQAHIHLNEALDQIDTSHDSNLALTIDRIRQDYVDLQKIRKKIDSNALLTKRDLSLPNQFFQADTKLITTIHALTEIYSRPYLAINPAVARQIRFSNTIWGITEYAGREYARLAQLIAEGVSPRAETLEELSMWRGRIQYGWELTHSAVLSNNWAKAVEPAMEEAETHYFITFDQIKDMFYQIPAGVRKTSYPITVEMWLELASQAVDSLHTLNDDVLKVNQAYARDIKKQAEKSIIISLLLFACALLLSFYSWWIITKRVLRPVNQIVRALDKATKGQPYTIPRFSSGRDDEIATLGNVLLAFENNVQQLQVERDNAQAANIAKSEFLANMSHEIRTPMNVILGLANILAESKPLSEKQAEYIKTLRLSGESLLSIINDVLDFSKIETQNFELEEITFNLGNLIREVVNQTNVAAKGKKLSIITDIDSIDHKEFSGDPTRMRQMLTNLCGNAIKFTEKGSITIQAYCTINLQNNMADLTIAVVDTGIGIPADKLNYIFDKFTQADSTITRKYGGTGLGLAITKTFIEMMDGTIKVESEYGQGSTFTLQLQLPFVPSETPVVISAEITPEAEPESDRISVLLVEDYKPNILVAETYLEKFGFDYEIAEDGFKAVEKTRQKRFDVILMDVQMQGMDGYQATQEIRTYEKQISRKSSIIIGMTAHALTGDREKCLEAGMDEYISKPFDPDKLEQMILVMAKK